MTLHFDVLVNMNGVGVGYPILTSSSRGEMEPSVYTQSFSADSGLQSFSLEARNMHTAPRSCK